ncbi:Modification methylase BspRI [bioreactor metagenome]|uniref:DNA (cytosine-5-)-methyltransferase n=1 Tax=bioreactor metagenome TaxID=1076179 RepID=A0A644VWN5_9ZZZZ
MADKLNYIDLFAGAGGLSEGFIRAGFNPVAHVEMDEAACNTLLTRTVYHHLKGTPDFQKYISYIRNEGITRKELHALLPSEKRDSVINLAIGDNTNDEIFKRIDKLRGKTRIDLIVGGPPCQAYSLVGRSRDKYRMKEDNRNFLFIQYAKYLEHFKPKFFVFENVLGLLSAKDKDGNRYFDTMRDLFRSIGYETEYKVLETQEYGVLQSRKRIILIGKRGKTKGFYPEFEKWIPKASVNDILSDLKPLKAGEGNYFATKYSSKASKYLIDSNIRNGLDFTTQHIARPNTRQDLEIYRIAVQKWELGLRLEYDDLPERLKSHKNRKTFKDRFKVIAGNLPSTQTIVAHIARDGHYYIHPDIVQNRSLTPREAARIQSFPDDYFFEGKSTKPSRTATYKQIGNAVPPLIAEIIAVRIKYLLT